MIQIVNNDPIKTKKNILKKRKYYFFILNFDFFNKDFINENKIKLYSIFFAYYYILYIK